MDKPITAKKPGTPKTVKVSAKARLIGTNIPTYPKSTFNRNNIKKEKANRNQ